MAREIKINRVNKATQFLIKAECQRILVNITSEETVEPSRSWIDAVLDSLQLHFKKPICVSKVRNDACSLQRLMGFYSTHEAIILACLPQLLFSVVKTMLSTTYRGKVLVNDPHELNFSSYI